MLDLQDLVGNILSFIIEDKELENIERGERRYLIKRNEERTNKLERFKQHTNIEIIKVTNSRRNITSNARFNVLHSLIY